MKKLSLILLMLAPVVFCNAQSVIKGVVRIDDIAVVHSGDSIFVSMSIDVSALRLGGNKGLRLKPFLEAPGRRLEMPTVEVMGRRRYIWHKRNRIEGNYFLRKYGVRQVLPYSSGARWEPWMDSSVLYLSDGISHCCKTVLEEGAEIIMAVNLREPEVPASKKVKEIRQVSISGTAYVGFPVNRSEVFEDFMGNAEELGKIRNTIEGVLDNPDITIDRIILKGYASPEGSWEHNRTLAENRTKALWDYILDNYDIRPRVIEAQSGAEDWDGLRDYVKNSQMSRKYDILNIIDGRQSPDDKEASIKKNYPYEYKRLLEDCYPLLRHTDYIIEYTIKTYEEKDENN